VHPKVWIVIVYKVAARFLAVFFREHAHEC